MKRRSESAEKRERKYRIYRKRYAGVYAHGILNLYGRSILEKKRKYEKTEGDLYVGAYAIVYVGIYGASYAYTGSDGEGGLKMRMEHIEAITEGYFGVGAYASICAKKRKAEGGR